MRFRVTVDYALDDERPSAAALEDTNARLAAFAPAFAARVAGSAYSLEVALTVDAEDQVDAASVALNALRTALGRQELRVTAQPVHPPAPEN